MELFPRKPPRIKLVSLIFTKILQFFLPINVFFHYFSAKPEEEVFAESYDDQEDNTKSVPKNLITNSEAIEKIKFMGYPCCPNKWNVYHECSLFCQNNWSSRRSTGPENDSEYAEIHKNTIEKYGPLPEDWQEKWDPGSGRHFYWCTRTGNLFQFKKFQFRETGENNFFLH